VADVRLIDRDAEKQALSGVDPGVAFGKTCSALGV